MDYCESVTYLESAARFGKKAGLDNIRRLLARLGNPQEQCHAVHVAGTTGKGSVCAMVEAVLRQAGCRTGLFTSPYLERFTERIRIDGQEIAPERVAAITSRVRQEAEAMAACGEGNPTFFELVTALGFCAFAEAQVEWAVIETGMGGRLDATNVLQSDLAIITAIGLDHTQVLGNTVEEIAREKAGIMKPGVPVVIYPQPYAEAYAELLAAAKDRGCPAYAVREATVLVEASGLAGQTFRLLYQGRAFPPLHIHMLGVHQCLNAATAALSCAVLAGPLGLPIQMEDIVQGLELARWPGRLEIIRTDPVVLLDGAHNPQGAQVLRRAVEDLLPSRNAIVVCGVMATKSARPIARELATFAQQIIATQPDSPKALEASEWAACFEDLHIECMTLAAPMAALEVGLALARERQVPLVVAGSLYLAGAARSYLTTQSGG